MPAPNNERARAIFWLQVTSLLVTGWIIWRTAFFPFGAQYFLPEGIAIALWYSCCALVLSGLITYVLLFSIRRIAREQALDVTLRTSAAGMWFAPAVILLGAASPLAITAALVLVVSVTRVLYSQWRVGLSCADLPAGGRTSSDGAAHDATPPALPTGELPHGFLPRDSVTRALYLQGRRAPNDAALPPGGQTSSDTDAQKAGPPSLLTGELPHGFLPRDFWPAFASAAALQAGFVFSHLGRPSLSGACYALGAAVLTAYAIAAGVWTRDREPDLPRSILAIAVTLMLTVVITIVGMQMYPAGSEGGDTAGGGPSSRRAPRHAPPEAPLNAPQYQPPPIDPARLGPRISVPGGVPGVILWPETRPVPLLVEPLPKGGLAHREASRPFIIPFAGSYWMFRGGFTRPPANSIVQRGTPTTTSFKTVDLWPLEMEAHQRLDREIDLACCAEIRIDVFNADKHPGTVTLELAVIDRAGPPIHLGSAAVRSAPDLYQDSVTPVPETLEFHVPSNGPVFDEFDVIFHRSRERVDRSARIAIQRFVLVPR